jgi:hypothetical protein
MGFMRPSAQKMKMYHVDSSMGTELIPHDAIGDIDLDGDPDDLYKNHFRAFLEGKEIYDLGLKEGWYSRLSANGFMDCTSWEGPFASEEEALKAVMDEFEVNENGDPDEEAE